MNQTLERYLAAKPDLKESSKANTNNTVRTFKLLYNYSRLKNKTPPENPVSVLTAGK